MKWILVGLLFANVVWAESSKIIPAFLEASEIYIENPEGAVEELFLRPDIRAALEVLQKAGINPRILEKYTSNKSSDWELREDDRFDGWMESPEKSPVEVPEIALHAFKFDVIKDSGDVLKDDIYVYFFITDGVIPTGKVTSIYKGLGRGQSFFFNEIDRAIFPLPGVPAKKPENHLIVDYGIIESDKDDIQEMQKLSSLIIDIALAVYSSYDPQNAQVLINLRKEVKALADMLLALNRDDRMAAGTLGYKVNQLEEMLRDESYVEVSKKHASVGKSKKWEYQLSFRFLRK